VFERDRIESAGAYRTAILNRRDLLMRQARLRAEIAGEQSFEIPAELAGTPDVDKLKAQELNLMRLRRVDIESQIEAASDLA
ncbi:exopolysaccharide biosynthesis protein, partial [Mesorhizobium sp. M1A.T.Ca.IN.004.03.1.1]